MTRLKTSLDAKVRQEKKKDEKIEMQKVEIANLTHKVKSLERNAKNSNREFFSSTAAAPIEHQAHVPSISSSMDVDTTSNHIQILAEAPPKPKRTRTKKKNLETASTRSSSEHESDLEMASLFMEEFNAEIQSQNEEEVPAAKKKRTTKKNARISNSEDEDWDANGVEHIPDTQSPPKTRTSKRKATSVSSDAETIGSTMETIPGAIPDSLLMPPPAISMETIKKARTNARESSSVADRAKNAGETSFSSTTASTSVESNRSRNKKPSESVRSSPDIVYELQPVEIFWKPICTHLELHDALISLVNSSKDGISSNTNDNSQQNISQLASAICCLDPKTIARSICSSIQNIASSTIEKYSNSTIESKEALFDLLLRRGGHWELPLLSLLHNCAHGTFASSTASKFIESMLNALLSNILASDCYQHGDDASASVLVRFYVSLCRDLGSLSRARHLLFELVRGRRNLLISCILASICAWPSIVESSVSGQRSLLSCTIEAILTDHILNGRSKPESFVNDATLDALAALRGITGWKLDRKDPLLLRNWARLLTSSLESMLKQTQLNGFSANKVIARGTELIRAIEIVLPHLEPSLDFAKSNIWIRPIEPIIRSLPCTFASSSASQQTSGSTNSETSAASISYMTVTATIALTAAAVLGRYDLIASGANNNSTTEAPLASAILSSLIALIPPKSALPFSLQLIALQSIIEIYLGTNLPKTKSSDLAALKLWYSSLPPLQRRHVPSHLEELFRF